MEVRRGTRPRKSRSSASPREEIEDSARSGAEAWSTRNEAEPSSAASQAEGCARHGVQAVYKSLPYLKSVSAAAAAHQDGSTSNNLPCVHSPNQFWRS
ncbi:hypothetical protein Fmac_024245 [Flemingia macrophylla]|uniref:Uncharacterized protein n=1 Tax=Flemingia macrophylla TaxID=520843 RepID=A0ABD1LNV6_9FABA